MVEVTGSRDCGNSPKNQFAQDVAVALESRRILPEMLSESVTWHHHDAAAIEGRDAVRQAVGERPTIASIVVEHAISHGKVGMANGIVALTDGTSRRFCHVFGFTSTKGNCVATISSYG